MRVDYLAVDYGTKKVGIAIGDSTSGLVLPKKIIERKLFFVELEQLLKSYPDISDLIIGENRSFDGRQTDMSVKSKQIADQIVQLYPKKNVVLYNERGTTAPYGREQDDKAAALLLEHYFHYVVRK